MLSGIILAGGENRRMDGQHKSFLRLGEEELIARQVREMNAVCSDITVVTNDPKPFLRKVDTQIRIITDYAEGKGPLGGMHAGLTLARNPLAWVVGCDMPYLSAAAALLMLKLKGTRDQAVIPSILGRLYPLHGIYDRDCGNQIWSLLMNQQTEMAALHKALRYLEARETDFAAAGLDTRFVKAIKTRYDYETAMQEIKQGGAKGEITNEKIYGTN